MGCDVSKKIRVGWDDLFQSTHPSGVRPAVKTCCRTYQHYFNPRTPVGCDLALIAEYQRDKNFNPRTPVGCDPKPTRRLACPNGYFNPRTPVGCDFSDCLIFVQVIISIHAPQWGATIIMQWAMMRLLFQSTHPSGVRLVTCRVMALWTYFNPRTPVGCDAEPYVHNQRQGNFNPRTPVGCDKETS